MNRKYDVFALALTVALFVAGTASAQTQVLNVSQDVPLAATLDNPCTTTVEAIAFTGTTHIDQQVWLGPTGSLRLIVGESASLSGTDTLNAVSPTYTASGTDSFDAEFAPGAVSIYDAKKVNNSSGAQDNFYVVVQLDFDPTSLKLTPTLTASCGLPNP